MKRTLLFVLTLSGLSALSVITIREYHFVHILKTWAEAQHYCREMFTDLATVENQEEYTRLSALQAGGKNAWIGLYDDLTTWRWSLGDADFSNNTDFSNWYVGKPVTKDYKEYKTTCTAMDPNGFWHSSLCTRLRPAVCFYERGPSRYMLVNTKMTWKEAREYCQSRYTDLVSVRNKSENDHISSLLEDKISWIGLTRNNWGHWSDQSLKAFTKWNTGQPDNYEKPVGFCAVVNTATGTWWDVDCKEKHYFICQKVLLQHKMTFQLKFQSKADLNDPAVQQQILEQLHAKLEKHGVPDHKLRWIETDRQTFHKEQQSKEEEGFGV